MSTPRGPPNAGAPTPAEDPAPPAGPRSNRDKPLVVVAVAEERRLARRLTAARVPGLEADDAGAGVTQPDRRREADDAGADDRDLSARDAAGRRAHRRATTLTRP